ncbi:uncharacterized protein SAPINGB_P003220 [Magnusiomyces paraingens]|uniref:DNA primase large subunit n=1 Tax=Magnusiomyces paraingens TaxID=2606893 RepID=A0A5E8BLL2_9ASCO|nr:uncharacterized protein SAPINGB_P003220 [Saprochaete ingens]VVT51809.1 unnamed protein product [Saprochaete ingens]
MFRQNFKRRRAQEKRHFADSSLETHSATLTYPYRLNFYDTPPTLEITAEEFEQWAIDRMRVLGEIESRLARNFPPKELEASLRPILDKYLPLGSNASMARASSSDPTPVDIKNGPLHFDENNEQHKRLKDHYSHFILRLAFCRSQELRKRFVHAETVLFRIRYNSDDPEERAAFAQSCNLAWDPVTDSERSELSKKLDWLAETDKDSSFFKVDFERVPDLVADRRVVLHNGKAYVPRSQLQSFVQTEFSSRLDRALLQTVRALPRLEEDDRLVPLLNHLAVGFEAFSTYDPAQVGGVPGSADEIRASNVDALVDAHYPLCMQTMHRGLVSTKHLRYNARLQYGNFLKWIGLSVDEALIFWRSHFNVPEDKFSKEYRYNIRHQYGLEGSRINYRPHSCAEIINGPLPARGEFHGCPYRTFSTDTLVASLQRMGINDTQHLAEIQGNVARRQYHVACTQVYELTHPEDTKKYDETITHPNQYFERSYKQK